MSINMAPYPNKNSNGIKAQLIEAQYDPSLVITIGIKHVICKINNEKAIPINIFEIFSMFPISVNRWFWFNYWLIVGY